MSKLLNVYLKTFEPEIFSDSLYYSCVCDLLESTEIQMLAEYIQHQNITRLEHVTSVSYLSFIICRKLKLNYKEASRGGLLHDLFFYDWHESDSSHRLHGYRHPGFAVRNAQRLYGPLSMMAENIIKRHMWPLTPTPPKYKEAFIVSFVDKYCTAQEIILTKTKRMPVRQK
jgi:uncharacterized protein